MAAIWNRHKALAESWQRNDITDSPGELHRPAAPSPDKQSDFLAYKTKQNKRATLSTNNFSFTKLMAIIRSSGLCIRTLLVFVPVPLILLVSVERIDLMH